MPRYSFAQREPREDPTAVIGLALRLADAEAQDFYARKNYEISMQREERDARADELRIAQEQMDLDQANGKLSEATGAYAHFSGINPADPAFGAKMAEGISMFPNGRADKDVSRLIESKMQQREQVRTDFRRLFGEDVDPDAHITDGRYDPNKMQAWAFGKKQQALAEQKSLADAARGVGASNLQFNAAGEPIASFQFADEKDKAEMARALAIAGVSDPKESEALLADPIAANRRIGAALREQADSKMAREKLAAWKAEQWKEYAAIKFDKLDIPGTPVYEEKVKSREAILSRIRAADETGSIPSAGAAPQPTGGKVRVYNPAGKAGWIPAENLEAALKAGFKRAE